MADIRPLKSSDAPAIARLEAKFHDASLRDGEQQLRALLETVEYERIQHSFGLFDKDELVGYLLSYGIQDSVLPPEILAGKPFKEAAYIEDVAILEPYRRYFVLIFNTFVQSVKEQHPTMPVEAIGIEPMIKHWEQQERWAQKMCYRTDLVLPVGEIINGHERYLIRWESLDTPPDLPTRRQLAFAAMDSVECTITGKPLTVRSLRRQEQLELLMEDWDRLLAATPGHTAFQTLEYQRLWWKYFNENDGRLLVLLVFDGQQIVGIAPLYLDASEHFGKIIRTLGFIGSRWEADRPAFLFREQFEPCMAACLHYLLQRRELWQRAYFYEQVNDARLQFLQKSFHKAGYLVGTLPDSLCPTINFSGTWAEFLAAKSRKFRKNIEAAQKKLSATGKLNYTVNTTAEANIAALETHRALENRSWKAAEGVGIGRSDDYFEFYREMAAVMSPAGRFVTRILSVGEQPVASTFGLLFNQAFFSLQIVHDDAFNKASPGTYLESLEIQECFQSGMREYDFLGGFLNNKSRWTDTNRVTNQLFVYEKTPYHIGLYLWSFHLKPFIKARLKVLRPRLMALRDRMTGTKHSSGGGTTDE